VAVAICVLAAPGFMRYASRNAGLAIDLYRRVKGVRESTTEGDSSSGTDGQKPGAG
jgi:hypothetical protein